MCMCMFTITLLFFHLELLLTKMFERMKYDLNKNELRYLMKKLHFPEEKMVELEQIHHGKEKLPQRIYSAMLFWKEFKGEEATAEELLRILNILGHDDLAQSLRLMKIYAQRLRF